MYSLIISVLVRGADGGNAIFGGRKRRGGDRFGDFRLTGGLCSGFSSFRFLSESGLFLQVGNRSASGSTLSDFYFLTIIGGCRCVAIIAVVAVVALVGSRDFSLFLFAWLSHSC